MENGTMEQTTETSGIDQSAMEADYMSTYQLVDDSGNPVENQSGDLLENKEQPQEPTTQKPEQPQAAKEDKTAGSQQSTQGDDYLKEFYGEDGSLDIQKAMQLFDRQTPQKPVEQQTPIQQPLQPQQPQQQQPEQPAIDPREQTRKNAIAALEIARVYISQGDDPATAMLKAEKDIDAHLNNHFMQTEIQKLKEEFEKEKNALREEVKNERELTIAEPKCQENLMKVCNKFKGIASETLRKAIFDKNIGGQFLLDLFEMQNPDKAKLTGEAFDKSLNDWFIKSAAKNERFVETLALNAVNQIQLKVQPELVKIIQKNAASRSALQQRLKPGPNTIQNPQSHKPADKNSAEYELEQFFHDVPRNGGRPHI